MSEQAPAPTSAIQLLLSEGQQSGSLNNQDKQPTAQPAHVHQRPTPANTEPLDAASRIDNAHAANPAAEKAPKPAPAAATFARFKAAADHWRSVSSHDREPAAQARPLPKVAVVARETHFAPVEHKESTWVRADRIIKSQANNVQEMNNPELRDATRSSVRASIGDRPESRHSEGNGRAWASLAKGSISTHSQTDRHSGTSGVPAQGVHPTDGDASTTGRDARVAADQIGRPPAPRENQMPPVHTHGGAPPPRAEMQALDPVATSAQSPDGLPKASVSRVAQSLIACANTLVDRLNGTSTGPDRSPVRVLTITLEPAELGAVNVRLRGKAGAVEVTMRPSNLQTAKLIEADKARLQTIMRDAGYVVDRITVDTLAVATERHGTGSATVYDRADHAARGEAQNSSNSSSQNGSSSNHASPGDGRTTSGEGQAERRNRRTPDANPSDSITKQEMVVTATDDRGIYI